ncbi:hypothetical protein OROGR_015257 [Orobanche gracilis]
MSTAAEDVKFCLKVMINKEKTKVLLAEADADLVDVLLSFLTLPLGTIVRILENHYGDEAPVLGSLTTLRKGLSVLDRAHFSAESIKQMLLNPVSSFEAEYRKLKLNIDDTQPPKYFMCEDGHRYSKIGMYHSGAGKCGCGKPLNKEISIKNAPETADNCDDDGGVFSLKTASFIITDDMRMVPNVAGSIMQTLKNLEITDTLGAELRNVTFGFNEVMDLLKGLFLAGTPLTDIIFKERQVNRFVKRKTESRIPLHNFEKEANSDSNPKGMILKFTVQKSTSKLLFAQAEEDFVCFIFSLLAIPLGGVASLLGGSSSVKNVDNLYWSVANIDGDKYLKIKDTKAMLLKPKVSHGYISKGHILPLEERAPSLYYCQDKNGSYLSHLDNGYRVSSYMSPGGDGKYVKGSRMYMVTDDLTVTPLCMSTTLSILNLLEIPLSDVKEVELHIGLEEALTMLKASLTSTNALTSLINLLSIKKCLKTEK